MVSRYMTMTYYRVWNKRSPLNKQLNIAPGKFVKKNKHSPIFTLYLYYLDRLYGVRDKTIAPGKKSKN